MPGVAAANTRHFMRKSPDFQEYNPGKTTKHLIPAPKIPTFA
jgi:hypothetical protein